MTGKNRRRKRSEEEEEAKIIISQRSYLSCCWIWDENFRIDSSDIYTGIYKYRRRQWHPTPVLLPGKSYGRRSLEGCSPWGRWGLDTTKQLHFHFSLSCIGEGNGNPPQCSCLENPRDGGAWWAAVYGVTQSRTWLKRLSSSSSSTTFSNHPFISFYQRSSSLHKAWSYCWGSFIPTWRTPCSGRSGGGEFSHLSWTGNALITVSFSKDSFAKHRILG